MTPPKIEQLRAAMGAHRWVDALTIAAKFPRLGSYKAVIVRAAEAQRYPQFYRELGVDPSVALQEGIAALRKRYP